MIFKQLFDKHSSTYTYMIASARGREALIIDPVLENIETYINLLKEFDLKLVKVIDTHIHADHITGALQLNKETNCSTIMGEHTPSDAVEIKVKDNEVINIDDLRIRAIYAPGHTSDSYSFILDDYLLYPAHDYNGKKVSTIGNEKKFNPRLQVSSKNEYVEIMNNLNLPKPQFMEKNVSRNIKLGAESI